MLLKDIAEKLGAKLIGNGEIEITHVANLKTAKEKEISFLSDPKYRAVLSESHAGAVILKEEDVPHAKCAVLVMKDPYVGFAKVAQLLDTTPAIAKGVDSSAVISPEATIGNAAATGFAAGKLVEHIIKVRHKVEHFQIDFLCEPMPKGRRTSHKIYSGDFGPRLLPHEFLGHRLSCLNMTGANGCCQY